MKNLTIILFVVFVFSSFSQTFTEIDAGLPSGNLGAVTWGDYDNDGDLDILITGFSFSRIYNNNNGVFTDINAGLTPVYDGSAEWWDYNNDSHLDILLTGNGFALIYRNNGNGTFTDIQAGLLGFEYSSSSIGDYDNDGDPDFIIIGHNEEGSISTVYCNNGDDTFTDIQADIVPIYYYGSSDWGDFDNDGDLDLLITGSSPLGTILKIYQNDSGSFTDINANITGIMYGEAKWGDYDSDGDPDIIMCGRNSSKSDTKTDSMVAEIYRNDNGSFTEITANITETEGGSVNWGDFDNDGNLDIVVTGSTISELATSTIYINNGDDTFTLSSSGLIGVYESNAACGDYDNDGDLDLLITGYTSSDLSSFVTKLYRNDIENSNTAPNTPDGLTVVSSESGVILSWNKSTDNETSQNGLSYNIYLGTSSQMGDVLDPMSQISTGLRKVAEIGNAQQNNSIRIVLPNGEYFWSVQAIDNTFKASNFASESSFSVDYLAPVSPTLRSATDIVIRRFTANWDLVEGATGYILDVATDSNFSNLVTSYIDLDIYNVSSHIVTIPASSDSTEFFYRVQAYNSNGESPHSDVVAVNTMPEVFKEVSIGLPLDIYGKVAWGDYNNDGFIDIFMSGSISKDFNSKLFKNNGDGTFSENSSVFPEMMSTSVAWEDYDNDGFIDLLFCGYTWIDYTSTYYTKIYRNKRDGTFEDINADLPICKTASWGDFNNDGFSDIIMTGNYQTAKILKNNGNGIFTNMNSISIKLSEDSFSLGDYDNDGDTDILISGQSGYAAGGYGLISWIYRNDGDFIFTNIEADIVGNGRGSSDWGDYDNDGDLDILISGDTGSTQGDARIYRNNGNDTFTDINAELPHSLYGSQSKWIDFDNDGHLDIFLSGKGVNGSDMCGVFMNRGNNTFIDVNTNLEVMYVNNSSTLGDIDNDGDIDIILSGQPTYDGPNKSVTYKNLCENPNTKPLPPANLLANFSDNSIELSWNKATDNETPQNSLSYNIYIGTEEYSSDTYSPQSDIISGNRKVVSIGNAGLNTTWTIRNLPAGQYFWGDKTIDQ
jgi:hypothetical protein